ncbi:hypothetical protein Tco_0832296 [Tanacetum coccineum]
MEDDVDINTLTMEKYMAWVQDDIRPGMVKPKIGNDVEFEINSNFIRELRRKLFKGTDDEDAHEHVRKVLEIADLFHFPGITHDAVMLRVFPITLKRPALRWINRLSAGCLQHDLNSQQRFRIFYTGLYIPTRIMLDSKGFIPLMTPTQALKSIQVMADHSRNYYDEATTRERIDGSSDDVDIKKLNHNIHVFQNWEIYRYGGGLWWLHGGECQIKGVFGSSDPRILTTPSSSPIALMNVLKVVEMEIKMARLKRCLGIMESQDPQPLQFSYPKL